MVLLSAWLYLMLTRAYGSVRVIYTDMCELSVNQYAYIMFMLCYNM